jgi:hypothetical protein
MRIAGEIFDNMAGNGTAICGFEPSPMIQFCGSICAHMTGAHSFRRLKLAWLEIEDGLLRLDTDSRPRMR